MEGLLALFVLSFTVGVVDSINPTTIAPAFYLATVKRAGANVASFTLGIFAVNFLSGLLIMLGPGQLILSVAPHPQHTVKYLLEIGAGVLAAIAAVGVYVGRQRIQDRIPDMRDTQPRRAFVVGASITAVELPTAFPYFAVIAAIVANDYDFATQLFPLLVFNIAFILPKLAILAVLAIAGDRTERSLARWGEWFDRNNAALLAATLALVSVGFFVVGAVGLINGGGSHPGSYPR
jgi:cytochrome c biogenesis protein CcdA